jgi:hypothetical protein
MAANLRIIAVNCLKRKTGFINFNYFSNLFKARAAHILAAILLSLATLAQNGITGNPDWQIKPAFNQGFILVHRISIGHLVKGYPAIYELNISKPALGNKLWHHENNMPDMGVTFQCIDFKNPSQLGYALSLAPYVEIPLNKKVKPSRMVLRLLFGATYITRSFDIHKNHKNIAIGGPLNAYVQFKWFWQLKLNRYLRFEPGFTFSHASNGRYRNPNLGLNVVSLNAALNIYLPSKKPKPVVEKIDSSTRVRSKNELFLLGAVGFNERTLNSPGLQTYLFSAAYQRNIRNTHKFSLGLDFFYDQIYQQDYLHVKTVPPEGLDRFRMSARVGYSYNVGRISFPIEVGYYIFQKANPDAPLVSRMGVRYYSSSGIVAHFGLRTHFAVAYNFEYGLGYRFFIR